MKDKANASFEVETSNKNILQYNQRNNRKLRDDNMISLNNQQVLNTEESDDFSREERSAEKNQYKIAKGEIFESQDNTPEKTQQLEDDLFFNALNNLFVPDKKLSRDELFNVISDQYGKSLQIDELIQLKTQVEIILGLPKNCAKHIILNKIKDLRANNMMATNNSEVVLKLDE